MSDRLYVIIVGCGRLGSHLAGELSQDGHEVVVIDRSEDAFERLTAGFSGFRLVGDVTEMEILRKAKVDRAQAFIACTSEDNVNLMAAQIARKVFGVPRVLARVFDPRRESAYARLGVETVSPTSVAAGSFLEAIRRAVTREVPT